MKFQFKKTIGISISGEQVNNKLKTVLKLKFWQYNISPYVLIEISSQEKQLKWASKQQQI